MVRDAFNVPLVFVSLVDQNRQWFKSTQWQTTACPRVPETGRDVSFCGHAIHLNEDEAFIIPNALEDERFADNPLVAGDLGIRFYAGLPLVVPSEDGHGTVNSKSDGILCTEHVLGRPYLTFLFGIFSRHALYHRSTAS